ncbi:cell envelope integrity EipB family protein [Zavarzinia compransoris]|uniref:DUF1849 domain-containing protein n=1 Tax=Zavarzinia compransoris TaxID=1264899 RepID=A0A317E8J4_9PROT|nr:cell envelope integrity EipB family protein [Zavarzinia compransoris]PWR23427.1 DUF1849 domain-containing protein [Zavarzinia compransoris]TDP45997.1 uncharacterized protein DUF1849 [Zavarzinia compransoris]
MLRRALVLTTALVALFFLVRWVFVGDETTEAASGETVPVAVAGPAAPAVPDQAAPAVPPTEAAVSTPVPAAPAAAPATDQGRLAGHRAIYELRLGQNRPGSGVAMADGKMVIEFADTCDGYTLTQRLRMRLSDGEGSATSTDFRVANWESDDGRRFRFSTRHLVNDQEDEAYEGSAELNADGSGTATYTKPEDRTETLIPGTVFPTMHTVELLRAAEAKKPLLTKPLFDGTGDETVYSVVGAIGRSSVADPAGLTGKGKDVLAGKPSWPVRLAFFSLAGNEELPQYEVGFRLYANGISGDIEMAYGDFSIDAVLSEIEALPKPDC